MRMGLALVVLWIAPATFAHGQVVQLPTVQEFGVQTTVSVPDGGGAYLGGVKRGAMGSNWSGLPGAGPLGRNRSAGWSVGASTASVHVTIIDLKEMEARLFPESAGKRSTASLKAERIASDEASLESVAAIKARHAVEDAELERIAQSYFQKGIDAERIGKLALARSHYLLAASKSRLELKRQAESKAAQLASQLRQGK